MPEWRKENSRPETPIIDQYLLEKLEKEKHLVYTPSRKLDNGKRIVCYDDRYIVRLAHKEGGVIVSNDQFRDLMKDNHEWKKVIEQRLLQFAFATDYFMPPDDPLGKTGPTLDQFLSKDLRDLVGGSKKVLTDAQGGSSKPICPHLGNCTFGRKCRYYHPDREQPPKPQQQQQQPQFQKTEQMIGSGLSAGHRTPTTTSRSATPSPSPDSRTHGSGVYSMVKCDSRGNFSNHSSSDDLYHERSFNGGVGSDVNMPTTTGIDISELSEKLEKTSLHHTSPSRKLSCGHDHQMVWHQPTGRVVSSPVLPEGVGPCMEKTRPHNHTFPLMHLSHREIRGANVTGDHSYLINQGASLTSQGHPFINQGTPLVSSSIMSDHIGHQHLQQQQLHEGILDNPHNLLPRDTRQSQYGTQNPSGSSPYSQHLPPSAHLPPSSRHYADLTPDPSALRRDHYQPTPPTHQLPSNSSALTSYGGTTRNIYPSNHHAHHLNMPSTLGYSNSHSSMGIDQSTIPLHNLHHLSLAQSQTTPPSHASYHHPAQQNYIQSTPANLSQVYSRSRGYRESMGSQHELYRAAVAVLPGCEQRVQFVLDTHLELASEKDLDTVVDLVRHMD